MLNRAIRVLALLAIVPIVGATQAGALGHVFAAPPPPPPPPGAIVVSNHTGTDSVHGCTTPAYTSIQVAVTASPTNSTIYVCDGTYNESLAIAKPLVLDGAQFNRPAANRSGPETIIDGSGGVTYAAGATTGTIDGFTLNGYAGSVAEIDASNVGSGWTFTDDAIDVSNGGIYLNTDGQTNPPATTIAQDAFVQATPSSAGSGDYGQAILLWANTANNVTIAKNSFQNLTGPGAAINTTQAGNCGATVDVATFGNNLTIDHNSFVNNVAATTSEDNFVALFCTTNAQITDNTVDIATKNDANASSPIYLGGGDWSTTVSRNHLTGNGASSASGIVHNSDFYASGTGVTISNNDISGFLDGIHVRSGVYGSPAPASNTPSFFTIDHNRVTGSISDGIAVSQGLYGTISDNVVMGSGTFDCLDGSGPGGSGSQGTYNNWQHNVGKSSSPAGLCIGGPH